MTRVRVRAVRYLSFAVFAAIQLPFLDRPLNAGAFGFVLGVAFTCVVWDWWMGW